MKNFYKKIKEQRGAALLMILAVFSLLIPLVQGVWMDTQIEYKFSRHHMSRLQARYNAKSGIGLSLLKLYIFKGVEKSVPKQWESQVRSFLDTIWAFPLSWPLPTPEELLESEKQDIQNLKNQSFLKGAYRTSISPEDGLLDVNNLSSPLNALRDFTYTALLNLLINSLEERPELKNKLEQSDFEKVLNNLSDWTDLDNDSQNGGREDLLEEGKQPLNRSFVSIEEIKKVPGMNLEIFEILSPYITVYGAKTLNINYSSPEILQALQIPEAVAEQILSRTRKDSSDYSPFSDQEDFCHFMSDLNFPFCEDLKETYNTLDMLSFGYPIAFRIKSTGEYRENSASLEALLYDLSPLALSYQKLRYYHIQREIEQESLPENSEREQKTDDSKKTQNKDLKFDYSYHKSLNIMYLREDP